MVGFPGPPAAPDVHVSAHRALTCLARWSAVDCCRFWGPWCRDGAAAVAVAGYRDVGCAGERGPLWANLHPWSQKRRRSSFMDSSVLPAYLARIQRNNRSHANESIALNVALDTPCRK